MTGIQYIMKKAQAKASAPAKGRKTNRSKKNSSRLDFALENLRIKPASTFRGADMSSSPNNGQAVSIPAGTGMVRRINNPQQRGLANGDLIIRHREYIADVGPVGGVTPLYSQSSFSINPGLPGTFPWLSGVAQRFESYRFNKLKFDFETESASTATGSTILSLDYDASDAPPTTKTQAMAFRSSVRSPLWSNCQLTCLSEDLNKQKSYFVRKGANPTATDIKLYDVGNLSVGFQGTASLLQVGELYVEYECLLMTPQLGIAGQGEAVWGAFTGSSNAAPAATVTGVLPATVVSTGTTTSVTTWTFTQPWQGILAALVQGTGLAGSVTFGGTATSSLTGSTINTATTSLSFYGVISANIGQTFILTLGDSTISLSDFDFAQSGTSF